MKCKTCGGIGYIERIDTEFGNLDIKPCPDCYKVDSRDKLITEQQLRIRFLEQKVESYKEACNNIIGSIYCIGGPLNDNCKQYTKEQMKDFWYIVRQAEDAGYIDGEDDE